ncbi:MAG: PH domain-containing protein [Acidimicrobiales bacterium]
MPIPARALSDGEEVVADVRPHALVLAGPIAVALAGVALAAVGIWLSVPRAVAYLFAGLLGLTLVNLLARYARWRWTSLVVTTHRVIRRSGMLSRSGREIPIAHISDVSYRQGLLERLIRAGDVRIESAGRDSAEVFRTVPRPARIQREITGLLSARDGRLAMSLPEQLDRLDDLRRRGVLSPQEFEASKARLLGGR